MISRHHQWTNSRRARQILDNWDEWAGKFVKVMPIDYRKALERLQQREPAGGEETPFTEEVFHG